MLTYYNRIRKKPISKQIQVMHQPQLNYPNQVRPFPRHGHGNGYFPC